MILVFQYKLKVTHQVDLQTAFKNSLFQHANSPDILIGAAYLSGANAC